MMISVRVLHGEGLIIMDAGMREESDCHQNYSGAPSPVSSLGFIGDNFAYARQTPP